MTERTTVRLPGELVRRAKLKAATDGISLTALIEEALRRMLDQHRSRRETARAPLPVSTATGGLMPGISLDSMAQLQQMDDIEYMSRLR